MVVTASLEELLNRGAHLSPHEAVAIVQQLIASIGEDAGETAGAPQDVILHADGGVCCRSGLPSIDALGRLLDVMLPSGNGLRVPGALRFTIARACNSVVAPPFASRTALSTALERFACGTREDVVRELLVRTGVVSASPAPADDPRPGRRCHARASDLRRELRKADERLFELLHPAASLPAPAAVAVATAPSRARWAAVGVAAVLGSFAAGYAGTELMMGSPACPSTAWQTSVARPTPGQDPTDREASSVR